MASAELARSDESGDERRTGLPAGDPRQHLNPKTALFFLSIFPQFVDPDAANAGRHSLVLGAIFVILATLFNSVYSLVASSLRGLLLRGRALPFIRRYVSGGFYLLLGGLAATAGHASPSAAPAR